MSLKFVFCFAICSFVTIVLGEIKVNVIHFELLDGKRCTTPLFSVFSHSRTACAASCAMTVPCKSQFFIPETKRCIGCDSVYHASDLTTLPSETGSWYYRPYALYNQDCSSDKPCIEDNNVCFAGLDTCVCDPFLVYDPSTASCTSDCSTFGETYQMYPDKFLRWNNGFPLGHEADLATCLSYCTNITTFTCYSVDHDYVANECFYNNVRLSTVPGALIEYLDGRIYIRNCA